MDIKVCIFVFLIAFTMDAIALGYLIYLTLFKSENKPKEKPESPAPTEEDLKIMEFHLNLINGRLGR